MVGAVGSEIRLDDVGRPALREAYRVDVGRLRKAERTAAGGVRIPAAIAREGILEYLQPDGTTIRELVRPEELARPEALASLRDAPITIGHPAGGTRLVTPETYREDNVGHVTGNPAIESGHLVAQLAILDVDAIRMIDTGELEEISAGYKVMIDPTPGVFDGERYDQSQHEREYNHVALLPDGGGRAGESVALRLDSNGNQIVMRPRARPEERIDGMKTERIDGIEYELGTTAWSQARVRHDAENQERMKKLEDEVDEKHKVDQELVEVKELGEQLKAKVTELEEIIVELEDPEKLAASADARIDLLNRARSVLGDQAELEKKSDVDVMKETIEADDPEMKEKTDAMSDDHIRGRFFGLTSKAKKSRGSSDLAGTRADALRRTEGNGDDNEDDLTFGREAPPDLATQTLTRD